MALKIQRSFRRVFVKVTAGILAIFLLSLACLYIWFVNNSKELLIELVSEKSGGKLKLELSDIDFDFLSSEVKIHKATIKSTNKDNTPVTYQVSFRKISLHTNSLWSLLIKRSVEIRQIKLYDPIIEVVNLQKGGVSNSNNNLSLGTELGKLYNSIQDAISTLNTHSIFIINAKLSLINKTDSGASPVVFSNIYFTLKKLNKHKGLTGRYLDSNNVIFSSSNQDITLTDGIHKLLFKKLVVRQARNIILDSCTIIALPTKTSGNSYTIQFKRLALIGVDFDTLYKTNLIRADSVYCENPVSAISLNSALRDENLPAKGLPDLEKVIKQFSGNLDLGFVAVRNADIHVNITGRKGRSNVNSGKGNFEIKNLRINPDSSALISIRSFDMLIKGYLLYNADSSCNYSFDSIRFANNKLLLNNFSVHTSSGIHTVRSYRDYSMPYFELLGLDWPELIFKQNLKAQEAILHDPTINYIKAIKPGTLRKSFIFNAHHTFDDFMEIQRLKIINGKINIKWGSANFLQLQGLDLSLLPNTLKSYKDIKLKKDVESLFFSGGDIKIGDLNARLRNVVFNTHDQIHADEVFVNTPGGIESKINDVSINNVYTEANNNIIIDGLEWEHGAVSISSIPRTQTNKKQTSFLLENISGKQTGLTFIKGATKCTGFIEDVHIASLVKEDNTPMKLNGFQVKGKEINLSNSRLSVNSENFLLSDNAVEFSKATFRYINKAGTLNVTTPHVMVKGNVNSFFANSPYLQDLILKSPVINYQKENTAPPEEGKISSLPAIKIDQLLLWEPVVNIQLDRTRSIRNFSFPYSKGSEIKAGNIQLGPAGVTVGTAGITTKKIEIVKETEEVLKVDNGINLALSKINISTPVHTGDSISWNALVNKFSIEKSGGFIFDVKDNKLELKEISGGDYLLSSASINDISTFITSNHSAWLTTPTLKYHNKNEIWRGVNIRYDAGQNLLSMDSANYIPSRPRDSVIASSPYQIDYINFSCSGIKLFGFDINKYLKERILIIKKVSVRRPSIVVYRDKFPPSLSGVVKELFTAKIIKIPGQLSIGQIEVDDGKASYTEKNAKSRAEGNLLLTHLNGSIHNIKNYDLKGGDSLSLIFAGRLQDAAVFSLGVKQSYTDPLYGFRMMVKIEPTPLLFLNPLLAPLSNIKLKSGEIDTFYMSAVGNENMAHGDMKFYYHGLHVQLLKNGPAPNSTSVKHVSSLLVNTFVVKPNNGERNGLIYFKRLKDRSFFNYMNKIIFSGVATSVGAKRNSQYRKDLLNDSRGLNNP